MSQSRDRVVGTALHMFAEHGYEGVSMRGLAGELGMQAPSLYSHFPSKDAMLVAVVGPFVTAIQALMGELPQVPVSADARHDWLVKAVDLLRQHPDELQLITNDRTIATHPTLGPALREITRQMVDCFMRFGIGNPHWAIGVTGAIVFAVLSQLTPSDTETIVSMAEAFADAG